MVKSTLQTNDQSGTFKCARSRCKTCSFIHNVQKISGPKRSIKITDHFTCTSANVIYCIICNYCNKLYIGETGRRLGDQIRSENTFATWKEMTRTHLNQSLDTLISVIILKQHMAVCGLSLHLGGSESCKTLKQKLSSKSAPLIPTDSTSAFHSTNLFLFSRHPIPTNSVAPLSAYKPKHNPQFLQSL